MADNKNIPVGAGGDPLFATDDIGGVNYPRSKTVWGADGAANDTSHAAPLPAAAQPSIAAPMKADGTGRVTMTEITIDATTAGGDNTLLAAPGAGLSIRVISYVIQATSSGQFHLKSGTTGFIHARFRSSGDGDGAAFAGNINAWAFTCAANNALVLTNPAATTTVGHMLVAIV